MGFLIGDGMSAYSCIRVDANFSGIPKILPLGSLNLQLPAVFETKVAVNPWGILPMVVSG